jgi:hypothetical protein
VCSISGNMFSFLSNIGQSNFNQYVSYSQAFVMFVFMLLSFDYVVTIIEGGHVFKRKLVSFIRVY